MTKVNAPEAGPRFAMVWIVLCLLAAGGGWLAGVPLPGALAAAMFMSLPGWAGLVWRSETRADAIGQAPFQVLSWTLVSLVAVAVSGGAHSPLTVLFALGPLFGLAVRRGRMALEAAVFAVLAYIGLVVLEALAGPPPVPEKLAGLELAFVLAGLVAGGWLVRQVLRDAQAGRVPGPPASDLRQVQTQGARPPPIAESAPLLIVELTRHGCVVRMRGRTSLAAGLRAGQFAEYGFGEGCETKVATLLRETGHLRLEREAAPTLDLHVSFGETRGWLLVMPASVPQDELKRLQARAQAEIAERTAFFASLGHDLKTPLNAIIGFSDMMQAKLRGPLPEPYDEYADIINDSAHELLLMVDDILDLARSETTRQRLDLQPVDLMDSARSVVGQLQPQAARAGVRLVAQGSDVWAMADARAVRQIWQNLLSNAIKYSDAGSKVRLGARQVADKAQLHVADQGAGMDEADLARIAEPFAQGENARGRVGTGLGLAVVKRFAEMHGGQVRIDTAPGEGTRVEVTLPLAESSESFQPHSEAAQ